MILQSYFDPDTFTVTYLVGDPETKEAAVIDPVLDFDPKAGKLSTRSVDRILAEASQIGLNIQWVLDTHAHADHLSAADYIRRMVGARYGIGERIVSVQKTFKPIFNAQDLIPNGDVFDHLFKDRETFQVGALKARVLHTPGHTQACVTFIVEDAAFVGDTLFMPDYGTARTDFPGGDARTLFRSIQKILSLPETTRIFVGHDYLPEGRTEYQWETTVAAQRASNIHVHDGVTEDEFVALREARDAGLSSPRLILPSLQVNIRAGAMPPPDEDGRTYLKIPVSAER